MTHQVAAMGVAPHSGWAAVVALGRTPAGLKVVARSRMDLIEPGYPESKQPYHAVETLHVAEAARRLELAIAVKQLGQQAGAPWAADQKNAALLAWLLLDTNR